MSPSLTKNLLITNLAFLIASMFCAQAKAAKYRYLLNFDARYGQHYYSSDVATNRHSFEYEQKAEYNNRWSAVFGLRAEVEAAYAALPERYGAGDVAKYDSQTFFARDNYLQYQNGKLRSRLGYQQIVWGEAFGLYYADIVNPKDLREAGLGDLSRNRLSMPMLNLQWITATSSVQALYIPKTMANLLPKYGSDFNTFKLPDPMSETPIDISREPGTSASQGEYGLRITQQFSSLDFSLFYLSYYDRMPIYQLQIIPTPLSAKAIPEYHLLQTAGTTLTADLNGYLLRAEILQHFERELNITQGSSLSSAKTNEIIYVLGLDLPPFDKWLTSFQFSESHIGNDNWTFREEHQAIASARIAKTFSTDIRAELQVVSFTSDPSGLIQTSINFPISSQAELIFGVDKFDGTESTAFGQLKDASRIWVMFKTTVKK